MEITKIFKETVKEGRLIGKRYTNNDRVNGSFGHKWGEFFQKGWFAELENAGGKIEFDYIAPMRVNAGIFEYWIGMMFAPDAIVPEGFDYIDIESYESAVFWICGNPDNGELYGMNAHNTCTELLKAKGWKIKENGWIIERYNCPRFTQADENGDVILDYYIAVE